MHGTLHCQNACSFNANSKVSASHNRAGSFLLHLRLAQHGKKNVVYMQFTVQKLICMQTQLLIHLFLPA